jgi:hypothetical protein
MVNHRSKGLADLVVSERGVACVLARIERLRPRGRRAAEGLASGGGRRFPLHL